MVIMETVPNGKDGQRLTARRRLSRKKNFPPRFEGLAKLGNIVRKETFFLFSRARNIVSEANFASRSQENVLKSRQKHCRCFRRTQGLLPKNIFSSLAPEKNNFYVSTSPNELKKSAAGKSVSCSIFVQ